ncbi:MAG TPA: TetR/AcrR family transcriptional regulator [Nitrospirota bacterium]
MATKKRTLKTPVIGRRPKTKTANRDSRDAILKAARRVFARRGFEGASTREVAEAARVNNAMIYYHFKNKKGLYRSVLSDSFSSMAAIWNDEIFQSRASVRQKIQKYVEGFIRFQQGNEDLRRILAMEFAGSGGKNACICEKYFADNYAHLFRIFQEGMRKGDLRKFDPSLAVASLLGVIVHNFILQPMAEHVHGRCVNLSPKKFGVFVTDLFFSGLALKSRPSVRVNDEKDSQT